MWGGGGFFGGHRIVSFFCLKSFPSVTKRSVFILKFSIFKDFVEVDNSTHQRVLKAEDLKVMIPENLHEFYMSRFAVRGP